MGARLPAVIGAVLATTGLLIGAPLRAAADDDDDAVLDWVGSLGFPDLEGARFGKARDATGVVHGFVIREDEAGVRLILFTHDARITSVPAASFEPKSLGATARAFAAETADADPLDASTYPRLDVDPVRRLGPRGEATLLAWACRARGEEAVAGELLAAARRLRNVICRGGACPTGGGVPRDFLTAVHVDFAYASLWRLVIAFGDRSIARVDLLERLRRHAKRYPKDIFGYVGEGLIESLETMVKEDEERARAPKALGSLAGDALVSELIERLRDQGGKPTGRGDFDIFADADGAANRLVDLGTTALPMLERAKDDERLTRAVAFYEAEIFSHRVLRIGDCAKAIAERIRSSGS